jgi:hypothetical protein
MFIRTVGGAEVVWDGWGIEGGDLAAEAPTRRPPVGPEMTAETPALGMVRPEAAASVSRAKTMPGLGAGPVGTHRSRTIGWIRLSGLGLEIWASSRTGPDAGARRQRCG